ncbi:hypothetical protein ARMSODRAFT_372055 [Armillaria solidipes]|uniref:Uncharacterized protein n=1 Tax=Armillaria solidipes TaxID=1076256 RepID=A0A2H3BNP2_9AGAR|nr:hypothetical protein ARMSODRAFT_372055 [Armillaria solidipes]
MEFTNTLFAGKKEHAKSYTKALQIALCIRLQRRRHLRSAKRRRSRSLSMSEHSAFPLANHLFSALKASHHQPRLAKKSNYCLISSDYGNTTRAWRCDPGCIHAMLLSIYLVMYYYTHRRPSSTYSLAIHLLHFFYRPRSSGHKHSELSASASTQRCHIEQCSVELLNFVRYGFFCNVVLDFLKRSVLNVLGIGGPRERE